MKVVWYVISQIINGIFILFVINLFVDNKHLHIAKTNTKAMHKINRQLFFDNSCLFLGIS